MSSHATRHSLLSLQYIEDNLGVMSIGFLLSSPNDAVIWRGPKKNGKYNITMVLYMTFKCVHIFK